MGYELQVQSVDGKTWIVHCKSGESPKKEYVLIERGWCKASKRSHQRKNVLFSSPLEKSLSEEK